LNPARLSAKEDSPAVLVVEDDPSLRLLCRVNLELAGYRVLEAPTVAGARDLLRTEEIAVVLLDVHVGGDSGYDLIEPIRAEPKTSVVLITGTAEVGPAERAKVDEVLPKPFAPDALIALVGRFTGGADR
jgi:two-component system response regulator FlrC